MVTITDIETGIQAVVKAGLPYLKTVGPIGEFLSRTADEIAILAPAVFIAYEGGRYGDAGANYLMDREQTFTLIAVVRYGITQTKLLHGDTTHVGVYTILEDLRAKLTGADLGLAMDGLVPVEESAIAGDQALAIYGISFRTRTRG